MMKNKLFITAILTLAFLACCMIGVSCLSVGERKAEAFTVTGDANFQQVESFTMLGAQVRVSGSTSGLRFVATIDKDEYDALVEAYSSVEMGMLVVPKNKLTGELTLDNTTDPIQRVYRSGASLVENGDVYEFRAVLYNIPSSSYGRDLLGRAYLTINDGYDVKTFYAAALTRNIAYVSYYATEVLSTPSNATYEKYIGDRVFHELELPEGAKSDYRYAYEGQTVDVTLENADAEMTVTGAASSSKTGNVYSITVGEGDVSASGLSATVDLGSFDTLVSDKTFYIGDIVGDVETATTGFSYNAATGVVTTTNAAGEYDVTIVTDAGYTYNLTATIITAAISSYSEFCSARDANTSDGNWSGYYVLTDNITIASGTYSSGVSNFTGTFDGRGHAFYGGTFHSGSTVPTQSLFGNLQGTLKNTAFIKPVIGILAGIVYQLPSGGVLDNCLFDCVRLGNTVYGNQAPIYDVAPGGTVSNCVFYVADGDGSKTDCGAFSMLRGTTSNVYVFSTKLTYWDNRSSQTGASLYAYSRTTLNAGLAVTSGGFSSYFDFTGVKASMNAKELDVSVDLFLDKVDGDTKVSLTGDLGLSSGEVTDVKVDGESVIFNQVGANVAIPVTAGEHRVSIKIGGREYFFTAIGITKKLTTVAQLQGLMSTYPKSGYYILGGNIDASGVMFRNTAEDYFSGTFDGRGYTISGATIAAWTNPGRSGLFGEGIAEGGLVKNVAFVNMVCANADTGGPLGNSNYGTIDNCLFDFVENPSSNWSKIHAVVSTNYGVIKNIVVYYNNLYGSNVDYAALSIFNFNSTGATITNAYVFSGNVAYQNTSNWKNVNATAAYNAALSTVNPTGLNECWYLGGTKAVFSRSLNFAGATATGKTVIVDGTDNTVTLSSLGIGGSLVALFNSDREVTGENLTTSQVDVTGGTLGKTETFYAYASGTLYSFNVLTVTEKIDNVSELSAFAARSNEGYYVLSGNINASGYEFMNSGSTFSGTFDGMGYAISGGTFISPNDNNLSGGLFGTIFIGATVKNLAITSAALQGEYSWSNCSILTGNGRCHGTIRNVYLEISSVGVKNGAYNSTYTPSKAIGLCGHADGGSVIDHVIVKSAATLNYNVCDMVLGDAKITNAYVIGGGSTNNGWKQDSSSVISITKVSSLSAEQQALFDSDIWGFTSGIPYFKKAA